MTAAVLEVTAVGRAYAVPDQVVVGVGVEATAPTVAQALRGASQGVERLLAVLDASGVAQGDRRTTGLSVHPAYDHVEQRERGQTASYGLQLVVRDLDAAGRLVQEAAEQVGDGLRVHGFGLQVGDPLPHQQTARREAVEAARAAAEQLATASGARLGELVSLVEGPQGGRGISPLAVMEARGGPVAPGEHEVVVAVTATYALVVRASAPA